MSEYNNPPNVVVLLVPYRGNLIMIRRNLPGHGYGELALPGGYQNEREDWLAAGIREFKEETGINILNPTHFRVVGIRTVVPANLNLVFALYYGYVGDIDFDNLNFDRNEVQEVVWVDRPVETAFPYHTEMVEEFFEQRWYETPEFLLNDYRENGF